MIKLHIPEGGVLTEDISVDISDSGVGTATPAEDYLPFPAETITFPAGSSDGATQSFAVKIIQDGFIEVDETIKFELGNVQGKALLGSSEYQLTINDDDLLSNVAFSSAASSTADEAQSSHAITIKLTIQGHEVLEEEISIDVVDIATGTATPDTDYAAFPPTSITFPAGSKNEASVTIELEILDDNEIDQMETIDLALLNLQGPGILGAQSAHTVVISDDDQDGGGDDFIETKIYWAGSGELFRTDFDGDNGRPLGRIPSTETIEFLEIDSYHRKFYAIVDNGTTLLSSDLDEYNSGIVLTELENVSSIAVDGLDEKIYWLEPGNGLIKRSTLDGTNVETIQSEIDGGRHIEVDEFEGKLYWSERNSLNRSNLDGTNEEVILTHTIGKFFIDLIQKKTDLGRNKPRQS